MSPINHLRKVDNHKEKTFQHVEGLTANSHVSLRYEKYVRGNVYDD
ncbi:MAG: hypothetical protein ABJN69_07255 [Hellea sp.]